MTEHEEVHKIGLLVARLDERTKAMQDVLNSMSTSHKEIVEEMDSKFVTKDEFYIYKWLFNTIAGAAIVYITGRFMGLIS